MTMTQVYITVFDISQNSYQGILWPILALIFSFLTIFLTFNVIRYHKRPEVGAILFVVLGLLFSVPTCCFTWFKYQSLKRIHLQGKDNYTEGIVQNFLSLPKQESFSVNGYNFSYSDYLITQGFNNMATHGGPIREGLKIKIWFVRNDILRLDVTTN